MSNNKKVVTELPDWRKKTLLAKNNRCHFQGCKNRIKPPYTSRYAHGTSKLKRYCPDHDPDKMDSRARG